MKLYRNKFGYKQVEYAGLVRCFDFVHQIKQPTIDVRIYNEYKDNIKNLGAMDTARLADLYRDYDVIMIYYDKEDKPIVILKDKRKEVTINEGRN